MKGPLLRHLFAPILGISLCTCGIISILVYKQRQFEVEDSKRKLNYILAQSKERLRQSLNQAAQDNRFLINQLPTVNSLPNFFLEFARFHPHYLQVRLLSQSGKEIIRINQGKQGPFLVDVDKLQDKSNRYYFKQATALKKGETLFSQLDNNVENGKVQLPHVPVLRVSGKTSKNQYLVLNIDMRPFFDTLGELEQESKGLSILVKNEKGETVRGSMQALDKGITLVTKIRHLQLMAHQSLRNIHQQSSQSTKRLLILGGLFNLICLLLLIVLTKSKLQQRRKLVLLNEQILKVQEQERLHLSRELHDDFGQRLSALKLQLQTISQTKQLTSIDVALKNCDQLLKKIKVLATGLRPTVLDDFDLRENIAQLIKETRETTGLQLASELEQVKVLPGVKEHLYRITQELLCNTVRHSYAQSASIKLRSIRHSVTLEVLDNGIGFKQNKTEGLGLIGILERVKMINGECKIHSRPGQGTHIKIEVPFHG